MRSAAASIVLFGTILGLGSAVQAGDVPLTTVRVASGLYLPVFATHAPGDFDRLFILEKRGIIRILNLKTGTLNAAPFLNIDPLVGGGTTTNSEQGLLGLAFHPDYQENGKFYVDYTNNAGNTTIAQYTVSPDPDVANTATTLILSFSQPQVNHNGGWIGFGPNDGYLYIGTGDGGGAGDTGTGHTAATGNAQDITNNRLGKLLRIDVDSASPYAIPPTNPFVGITGDDEIWAYGLRNPWRPSFDRATGDLWIADVGQDTWEEINFQPADSPGGENYGWRCREGKHNFNFGAVCVGLTFVEPFQEYVHSATTGGFSITGGYVYRGCAIPSLQGTYFYADYVIQRIWSLRYDGSSISDFQIRTAELSPSADGFTVNQISSFGEDAAGELYIVDQGSTTTGQVFKIIPETPPLLGDINNDGLVNVTDLVGVIGSWGPCQGCPADTDCSGVVDVTDLITVISNWSA